MKKIAIFSLIFLSLLKSYSQNPKVRVLYVDSVGFNQVASWLLSQVAISGYYDNLLHLPTITIAGVTHPVTDGMTWNLPTGGTVTSITPGWGHQSQTVITNTGNSTIDSTVTGVQTKSGINKLGVNTLSKSSNYTILTSDFVLGKLPILYLSVDCTSGNLTQTLPSASSLPGATIYISKSDNTTNYITISGITGDNLIGTKGQVKVLLSINGTWTQN